MDLVDALRKKIDVLNEGEYITGLKAVLLHIETAFRHLSRGQETGDETAFTDAIYRTNQAFEGSIKEAYRALAGQDPSKKRPYDIEGYLEQNNVFRPRVLSQLTTYRTEWRNPSAHDYKLDFDESEAFLAIVSVSAFSCLLLDQIAERVAFERSKAEASSQVEAKPAVAQAALIDQLSQLISQFCSTSLASTSSGRTSESQVVGALHGFLAATAPDMEVLIDSGLGKETNYRADVIVKRGEEKVLLELKRSNSFSVFNNALVQVENYMLVSGIKCAILLFWPESPSEMEHAFMALGSADSQFAVMAPQGSNLALLAAAHALQPKA